jgi:cell division control protein 6
MNLTFTDILSTKTVFLDRDVLSPHFLPEKILHREEEIKKIMKNLSPIFSNKKPKNIFIYGKTGTGKTSSIKYVIKELEKFNLNSKILYINCRIYNTKYKILQKASADLINFYKNGFPPNVLYEKIFEHVSKNKLHLILVLDEIDSVKDINELIYTLTRTNDDLNSGSISFIGISNKIDFKRKLDQRSKSALIESEIVFPPYKAEQLREILLQRAQIGFRENCFDISSINLAAAIAASETGDARYALKLLLYAGEIADERGDSSVRDFHVELARKTAEMDIVVETISTLPEHQQISLYAIAQLSLNGSKYQKLAEDEKNVFLIGEVYEMYKTLCRKLNKEFRSMKWFKEYIRELNSLGLVTTMESGKGIRGHSTLVYLNYPSEKIKEAIKSIIAE